MSANAGLVKIRGGDVICIVMVSLLCHYGKCLISAGWNFQGWKD